ncbi:MAG: VWA domain-containing protein [Acidobacteriota bacterium]|jgi:VWFA-related protein|nr:VWA domain-containing protein [Acidobacteriota bacterium]
MKIAYLRGLYLVSCFLFFLPYLAAQDFEAVAADTDDPYFSGSVIRVNSSLVSVPVAATDASGREVIDLRIEDFRLAEDGRQAEISRLLESSNLNMTLLFDISGSVSYNFEFEQNAAIEFLKRIWKEGDAVTIISFDEQPEVRLKNGDNLQEAMWTLRQLKPTGRTTSFFDALILAAQLIEHSEETRQAIIVISDGADNTSKNSFASALMEMQRRNSVFYAINPSGAAVVRLNKGSGKGQENLEAFAKATGGGVFVSDNTGDLENIFSKIVLELRAQYLLLYYSLIQGMDGKFHTIEVSIPGRPELNIRARPGFLAVPR